MKTERETRISALAWVCLVIVFIGAINWALVGLFDFNLVARIFGVFSPVSRAIYVVVGLAGLYLLVAASSLPTHDRSLPPRGARTV